MRGFQSVFRVLKVLRSVTRGSGMLWPMRSILKPLQFIAWIYLSRSAIRPAILLSLKELKSPLSLIYSQISSLLYSIKSSSYNISQKDYIIMIYLSLIVYTPCLQRRFRSLRIVIKLLTLKITSIKSVKSFLYYFYKSLFSSLKYLYSRVLNLI